MQIGVAQAQGSKNIYNEINSASKETYSAIVSGILDGIREGIERANANCDALFSAPEVIEIKLKGDGVSSCFSIPYRGVKS